MCFHMCIPLNYHGIMRAYFDGFQIAAVSVIAAEFFFPFCCFVFDIN